MSILNPHIKNTETVYIIAEACVNHNGSLEVAKQLVEAAAKSGADAVKFQTSDPPKQQFACQGFK